MILAVTWAQLGSSSALLIGIALAGFAAGMSSNPSASAAEGKTGCTVFIVGLLVALASGGTMLYRWLT